VKSANAEGLLTLRAAIYARKSTDDSDKSDELKSVAIQVESARRFAEQQGFRVLDEHVYCDDKVSGARISRPRLDRMLAALGIKDGKRRAPIDPRALPFEVLVVRDQSRLIRNSDHATRLIKLIVRSGVKLWYYKERRQVQLGFAEELLTGVQGQVDSARRIEASQDAREGLSKRALKGFNTGGCVYGYDNVPVLGTMASGQPMRLHTDFRINPEEALVVRRIFRMYADGYGPRKIAKTLNGDPRYASELRKYFDGERREKPRVGKRGSGSWAPTAIRDMLRNERYSGVITFGRWKNDYDEDGEKARVKQDDPRKIVRTERPELRILDAGLWAAAQHRIRAEEQSYLRSTSGNLHGRPARGLASKYLLSGLVRCGCCGSSMVVSSQPFGAGESRRLERVYICNYRSHRGSTVCENGLRPRMARLDDEVLTAIEQQVLTPQVVRGAVKRAIAWRRAQIVRRVDRPAELRRAIAEREAERERLVKAIRMGGALESLVEALSECEHRLKALQQELAQVSIPLLPDETSAKRLERVYTERLGRWRDMLAVKPQTAREALRALMPSDQPIVLTPEREGYLLRGATKLGSLLFGDAVSSGSAKMASPRGFEPRLPPMKAAPKASEPRFGGAFHFGPCLSRILSHLKRALQRWRKATQEEHHAA
jgi:site-specific DNA recombinase